MRKVVCSRCGGPLIYETFTQCGKVRKVTQAGKLQKRVEYREYGGDGMLSDMVYCLDCGHPEAFKFDDRFDAITLVEDDSLEGEDEY